MLAAVNPRWKLDVPFQPGDVVDVGYFHSCRYIRKTVTRVDEVADLIEFHDGTTYHHEQNPDVHLIQCRPGVVVKMPHDRV